MAKRTTSLLLAVGFAATTVFGANAVLAASAQTQVKTETRSTRCRD